MDEYTIKDLCIEQPDRTMKAAEIGSFWVDARTTKEAKYKSLMQVLKVKKQQSILNPIGFSIYDQFGRYIATMTAM